MDVVFWIRRLIFFGTVPLRLKSGSLRLSRFTPLFGSLLDWRSDLLFHVEPTPAAQLTYGYSLFVVFILFGRPSFAIFGFIGMIFGLITLR